MCLGKLEPKLESAPHFRVSIGSRLVTARAPQERKGYYNPFEVLAPSGSEALRPKHTGL